MKIGSLGLFYLVKPLFLFVSNVPEVEKFSSSSIFFTDFNQLMHLVDFRNCGARIALFRRQITAHVSI